MNTYYFKSLTMKSRDQDLAIFSVKDQIVNVLGFVGHMVSVTIFNSAMLHKSSQRQYVNKWLWLCSNKTYLQNRHRTGFSPWAVDFDTQYKPKPHHCLLLLVYTSSLSGICFLLMCPMTLKQIQNIQQWSGIGSPTRNSKIFKCEDVKFIINTLQLSLIPQYL